MEIYRLSDDLSESSRKPSRKFEKQSDLDELPFAKKYQRFQSVPGQKTVTDLREAMRDKTRVNVFLDGKFAFSLTIAEVVDLKIKVGKVYKDSEIEEIESVSNFGKFYQRTLEYALSRPHSEKEIRDHLKQKKMKREIEQKRYDEYEKRLKEDEVYREKIKDIRKQVHEKNQKLKEKDFTEDNRFEYQNFAKTGLPKKPGAKITDADIERAIKKLKEAGVIDDEHFARFFVENRNVIKGTSERKLRGELKKKGISESIINKVFETDEFGEKIRDDEKEIEKMILKKRRRGYDDQKLTQYLLRQGFSYDLIKTKLEDSNLEI